MVTLLILGGLVALVFRQSRGWAWLPLGAAGAIYLVFSNGLVATLLMRPLEYAYPALKNPASHPEARTIVVLTGYAARDRNLPLSSRLNSTSAFRVIESAFIFAKRPDCKVIVSGSPAAASIMAGHLRQLGVPDASLTVDRGSSSTVDSALRVSQRTEGASVFLVTSAGHMPRAVASFLKQGVKTIPAPTDYRLPREVRRASWTQSPTHLRISDLAAREYLALAWYRLTGRI